jgi:hypothetical protein
MIPMNALALVAGNIHTIEQVKNMWYIAIMIILNDFIMPE